MNYLVHFNPDRTQAHGVWWVAVDGVLHSLYKDPQGGWAMRGRLTVYNKSEEASWDDWFTHLTSLTPYFDEWTVYDSMGFTPEQLLNSVGVSMPAAS